MLNGETANLNLADSWIWGKSLVEQRNCDLSRFCSRLGHYEKKSRLLNFVLCRIMYNASIDNEYLYIHD